MGFSVQFGRIILFFFLFLVCLQEKGSGQSAARRQRMLAACVRVFLFYARESNRQAISDKVGDAAQIHHMN